MAPLNNVQHKHFQYCTVVLKWLQSDYSVTYYNVFNSLRPSDAYMRQ